MKNIFARLAGIALVATFSLTASAGITKEYKSCLRRAGDVTPAITACALEYSAQLSLVAEQYLRIAEESKVLHINDQAWFQNTEDRCTRRLGTVGNTAEETNQMALCLVDSYKQSVDELIQNLKDLGVIR